MVSAIESINQRDLRLRSRAVMDAVEQGHSFVVTRDGREIGQLIPLRRRRRFILRAEFAAGSSHLPAVDPQRFRADQEHSFVQTWDDPYDR